MPKPPLNTKKGKYFLERAKGKSKKQSALSAGFTPAIANIATERIENTQEYKKIELAYADRLQSKISLNEITDEHVKLIKQDTSPATKLEAIKFAIQRIEPENKPQMNEEDRVLVVIAKQAIVAKEV